MARNFLSASSQFLRGSGFSGTVDAVWTAACWAKPAATGVAGTLLQVDDGTDSNRYNLQISSGDLVQAFQTNNTIPSNKTASTSTSVTAGAWQHACIVNASHASMSAYLNGAGKGTSGANSWSGTLSRLTIGARNASVFFNGAIAEVAIWQLTLTDAEILALAAGVAPWFVHPEGLITYAPLLQGYSPDIDIVGGKTLTLTAAPTLVDGPPIRNRSGLGAMCA